MPRYRKSTGDYHAPPEIIRYIKVISGTPKMQVVYNPKLEYALENTTTYVKDDFIVSLTDKEKFDTLFLYTNFDKEKIVNGKEINLTQDGFFTITYHEKLFVTTLKKITLDLERTKVYWLNWMDQTPTYEKYNDYIARSAMTLKLLTYDKTGAVLAAITTSLPETIGEVRNWDYRFCWIRDASMVIKVVSKLGHKNIVKRYLQFIIDLIPDKDEKLQIMYGINREKKLTEEIIADLERS